MKRPFMMFCILVILLCMIRLYIFDDAPPSEAFPKESVTLQGRVVDLETDADRTILYLSDVFFYGDSAKELSNYSLKGIRCYPKENDEYKLGQVVAVQGFLQLPDGAHNDGGFDGAAYYSVQGYEYVLYDAKVLATGEKYDVILECLRGIRAYAGKRLRTYLDAESSGIMTAMLLGDKSKIPDETKDLYRGVGIYHILAISGLHIAMIGGMLYKVLKHLRVRAFWAVFFSVLVIVLYGIMIGMPPSAFRAIIMFGFGLTAPLLQRSHDKFTSMAVAAVCLILWNPMIIKDAGLQLSFLAVLGIIWLYPTFLDLHRHHMKVADGLWVSFAVTYMTLPIIMRTYYEFPLYSILANVCIVPLVPILIGLGIVIIAGVFMPEIILRAMGKVIEWILFYYEKILNVFTILPWDTYVSGAPADAKVIFFYAGLGIVIYFVGVAKRKLLIRSLKSEQAYQEGRQEDYVREQKLIGSRMRCLRVVQVVVMGLLLGVILNHETVECRITFLDVGQGDGICIETEDGVYLIDCGSTSEDFLAKYTLIPFLKYHGITRIDGWFLTHPDGDHVSGWTELCSDEDMSGIKVDTLYIPKVLEEEFEPVIALARDKNINVVMLNAGDILQNKNVKWTVISPEANVYYQDNNTASLVLYFESGNVSGLFMGDAGMEAEIAVTDAQIKDITFLKVAHHGSGKNANSEDFFKQIEPQIAIISCGENNPYGHPHTEVLQSLENCKIPAYRTDKNHQVTIESRNRKIYVKVMDF